MKEFYQQTVKEVLDRVESRETGLTGEQGRENPGKGVAGMNLQRGKRKVSRRFSWNSIRIFWY